MKKIALVAGSLAFPLVSFAALGNISGLVSDVGDIITQLIPIFFTLALLGFFYGLVVYIFGGEDRKEGAKQKMLWGVIALFVMASVWGLVKFVGDAVGVDQDAAPDVTSLIPS